MGAFEFEAFGRESPKSSERERPTNSRMRDVAHAFAILTGAAHDELKSAEVS